MSTEPSPQLVALVDTLTARFPEVSQAQPTPFAGADSVLCTLIESILLDGASAKLLHTALASMHRELVDYNELRICTPSEIASLLGARYPGAMEHAERLRSVLHEVYTHEHALTLSRLESMPKREARSYLESLAGLTGFAAARTMLLALGAHAAPVDHRVLGLLKSSGVCAEGDTAQSASQTLERQLRAGETLGLYLRAELAIEADGSASSAAKKKRATRERSTTSKRAPSRQPRAKGDGDKPPSRRSKPDSQT